MNKNLSRIVADLFEQSKGGEELSSKIQRLRDEIYEIIESEDTIFGKFRALVESFREIIPEEKQRFNAAIKALSTTSKLSRKEIVKAVNSQLEELKILEKGLLHALPNWRDELKAMEARSQEMRSEILKLREIIVSLEIEEKGIVSGMATREKEMELVQKAMKELFTDIEAEIADIKERVEEFTAESVADQPASLSDFISIDSKKEGGEQKKESDESPEPQDTEWQKKCPMCGGRINFHVHEKMWQCYSCAYEEPQRDEDQDEIEETSEEKEPSIAIPVAEPLFDPFRPRAAHMDSLTSDDDQKSKKKSALANIQSSTKKKTCPGCRKKMLWYQAEKAWRCPFCEYERSI
jgi:ribosomal protein L37AE/L43A